MKYQKIHQLIDWCIIAIFLFFIVTQKLSYLIINLPSTLN